VGQVVLLISRLKDIRRSRSDNMMKAITAIDRPATPVLTEHHTTTDQPQPARFDALNPRKPVLDSSKK